MWVRVRVRVRKYLVMKIQNDLEECGGFSGERRPGVGAQRAGGTPSGRPYDGRER